jgi:hypothetical protein
MANSTISCTCDRKYYFWVWSDHMLQSEAQLGNWVGKKVMTKSTQKIVEVCHHLKKCRSDNLGQGWTLKCIMKSGFSPYSVAKKQATNTSCNDSAHMASSNQQYEWNYETIHEISKKA